MTDYKTLIEVLAPDNAKYILDVFPDGLPKNCILDKVTTGCGATYSALVSIFPTIIAVPTRNLIVDKVTQDRYKHLNILAVSSDFPFNGVPAGCNKIICTYESLPTVAQHINISNWNLVVDEMHTIHRMISFARKSLKWLEDNFKNFASYCFVSATVPRRELLLFFLKDLNIVRIKWPNKVEVSFDCLFSGNLRETVLKIIYEHVNGTRKGNPYFFYNSVLGIVNIAKCLRKVKIDYSIICSRSLKTKSFLRKYGLKACLPSETSKINFITSTAFEGVDFYDPDGVTYIICDANYKSSRYSLTTTIPQIVGRLRDSKYNNNVCVLFNGVSPVRFTSEEELNAAIKYSTEQAIGKIETYNEIIDKSNRIEAAKIMLGGCIEDPYIFIDSDQDISIEDLEFIELKDFDKPISIGLYEDAKLLDIEEYELLKTNIYINDHNSDVNKNHIANKLTDVIGDAPFLTQEERRFFRTKGTSIRKLIDIYSVNEEECMILDPEIYFFIKKNGLSLVNKLGRRNEIKNYQKRVNAENSASIRSKILAYFKPGFAYSNKFIKEYLKKIGLEHGKATMLKNYFDVKAAKIDGENGLKIIKVKSNEEL